MPKALTSTIQNAITNQRIGITLTFTINDTDYTSYLQDYSISSSKEFGSAAATFTLTNPDNIFGNSGANQIDIGDVVSFIENYTGDTTNWKSFYGIVNQRSINEAAGNQTITLVCLDYIAVTQFLDIDLTVEGTKVAVTNETLTPNFLPIPNEALAQVFDFANNSIADNPLPIIMIYDRLNSLEDPQIDGFQCVSSDTEILTENGWRLLKNIVENKEKIKVATLNPETNIVEYHYPINYIGYKYNGKMLYQESHYVNFIVTPNHNIYCKNKNHKHELFHFLRADSGLYGRYTQYKADFPYEGKEQKYFSLPQYISKYNQPEYYSRKNKLVDSHTQTRIFSERKIPMDDWLAFLGIWLAEGWITKNYARKDKKLIEAIINLNQNEGSKLETMKCIVSKIHPNFECKADLDRPNNFTIRFGDVQLAQYLKQFGKARDKFIPRELLQLSKRQLKILLDALMLGDGGKKGNIYHTSSTKLADDVQELVLRLGYTSKKMENNGSKLFLGGRYSNNISYNVSIRGIGKHNFKEPMPNYTINRVSWIDYNDYVYCVEVPNHTIYIRRDGIPSWTGNCLYETGQLKLGSPLNALHNYDIRCRSYSYYTKGVYAEDVLLQILTQANHYGSYLFGETSAQAVIDNHLKSDLNTETGSTTDTLTPNTSASTITIEIQLAADVTEGVTSVLLDSTDGLPESGEGSINGNTFTWASIGSANTLEGIPSGGEYSLKAHNEDDYFEYEATYEAGRVWYATFSNWITDLTASDFTIPSGASFAYLDKRYGRIILDTAIDTSATVTCDTNYYFYTLGASGIELNKISFKPRELANAFEAIQKLRNYLAPNWIIRTQGDNKIWASYLSQKTTADYTLNLVQSMTLLEDQDLYTRVIMYGKNRNPTNLVLGNSSAEFYSTGEEYKGLATRNELNYDREEGNFWVYQSSISNAGYIDLETIVPIVYINDVAIDNQLHQMIAVAVLVEVTTRTETKTGCHSMSSEQYVKIHTYYYYQIKFQHQSIEPSQPIYIYDSLGATIFTISPYDTNMDYAHGIYNVPGEEYNGDAENASTATYWVFYSSGALEIDYDNVEFKIDKSLIPDPNQAIVTATYEYWTVMIPIHDIASVIDGRWDTQVQIEFYAEPPSEYPLTILDLGATYTIQAIDIVAGFFKPDLYRKIDIDFNFTIQYSTDGTNYYNIGDATHNAQLSGGESVSFEEDDLGTDFEARYLKILIDKVKKIEFEDDDIWVVAFSELSLYNNIVIKSQATLIPTCTLTANVSEGDNIIEVDSTEYFEEPDSGSESTAYIGTLPFTYTGLTSTLFLGVELESGTTGSIGDLIYQDLESDTTVKDDSGLLRQLDDRIYKDVRISEEVLYTQSELDNLAKDYLQEFVKNHTKIQANILFQPFMKVGQTLSVTDSYNNISDTNYFIESINSNSAGQMSLVLARYPA